MVLSHVSQDQYDDLVKGIQTVYVTERIVYLEGITVFHLAPR